MSKRDVFVLESRRTLSPRQLFVTQRFSVECHVTFSPRYSGKNPCYIRSFTLMNYSTHVVNRFRAICCVCPGQLASLVSLSMRRDAFNEKGLGRDMKRFKGEQSWNPKSGRQSANTLANCW